MRQALNAMASDCSHVRQDWREIEAALDANGHAILAGLLSQQQCETLADLYTKEDRYRSRVIMARHGFGRGEYKYFAYPLPSMLDRLRHTLYAGLAPIANRWNREYPYFCG